MKKVNLFIFGFLMALLVGTNVASAFEVSVYGRGIPSEEIYQGKSNFFVDLGMHSITSENWKTALDKLDKVVILPNQEDIKNIPAIEPLGVPVIVSDWKGADTGFPVLPSFFYHENEHTLEIFNWSSDFPDVSFIDTARKSIEKENPDQILMIVTEKNAQFIKDQLTPFQEKTEWIIRDEVSENFVQNIDIPEKPVIYFFFSSRCPICRHLKNDVTPPVFEKYQDQIKVIYLDYVISAHYEKLVLLEETWQVEHKTSVEIFSDAGYIASEDEKTINEQIEELIQKTLALSNEEKKKTQTLFTGKVEDLIFNRFKGFTPWVVAGAGVLDGLNPCAFATIIFMVNLLMAIGHTRRRIFEIGIAYSLSVFFTYLLMGFGIFHIWQTLSAYQIISRVIYGVMASVLIIFAILSIKDAIQYRKDKKETEFSMGLPKSFRIKINQYLKKSFSEKKLIVAAIFSGFVISLLEAGCTGQIYLPTIMYIARESTSLRAFFFLLLYNTFFIIPLLVVFLGVYYGSQSKALVNFGRKNILFSKLAMGSLFIVLSILLWQSALS